MKIGPVSFLFAVVGGWTAMRAAMLLQPEPAEAARDIDWAAPLPLRVPAARAPDGVAVEIQPTVTAVDEARARSRAWPHRTDAPFAQAPPPTPAPALLNVVLEPVTPIHPPQPPMRSPRAAPDRFGMSAWAIVRGSGGSGLAAGGQLGGSQAGARARYDLGRGLAVAARLSGPLGASRGKEAAVAFDWRPFAAVPITLTVERRAGLDSGGRDAFAAGMFGGFAGQRLPLGFQLDGYGQAGVVGLKRRNPYVDGALRVERPLATRGRASIGLGAGLWGGAQSGLSRLDGGPQIVAHAPLGPASIRIGAEWRQRLAGNARPGSGPALTVGADF